MACPKDLQEHLGPLEEKGKLVRVNQQLDKDTETMSVVRLKFRGLPEEERKGFL